MESASDERAEDAKPNEPGEQAASKMPYGEAFLRVVQNLVVSFHCQPVERPKVNQPVLTYGVVRNGLFELHEIQFAGSLEGRSQGAWLSANQR